MILGAKDQPVANESGRGESHFFEVVGIEQFVFIAGANDVGFALFVEAEDLAVVAPGGGAEVAAFADAGFVGLFAGFRIETGEDAVVSEDVNAAIVGEFGGGNRCRLWAAPRRRRCSDWRPRAWSGHRRRRV